MKVIPADFEKYRRKDGKIYLIYRVDVLDQDRYYIGSRACDNVNDNYYGTPAEGNDYYSILQESKDSNYDNLVFTVLKWTTKQKRYIHEEEFLQLSKDDPKILNKDFRPTNCWFAYEPGDPDNPFIKQKERISEINRQKNISWAGKYHFYHPDYGDFKSTITELIKTFRDEHNLILDRGMMNLIGRHGHLRDGFPPEYKRKMPLKPTNKYYNWTCKGVLKAPYIRSR